MDEEIIESPSMLCRICFDTGIYKLNTQLDVENENLIAQEMLNEFSSIEQTSSENIPAMLCSGCLSQLGQSYMFLKKVQRADLQIRQIFDCGGVIEELDRKSPPEQKFFDDELNCEYEVLQSEKGGNEELATNNGEESSLHSTIADDAPYVEADELILEDEDGFEIDSFPEKPKSRKRPNRTYKKPLIVLTENVSNILSRAQHPTDCLIEEDLSEGDDEPSSKKIRPDEKSSYFVTKFVMAEATTVNANSGITGTDDIGENENNSTTVNQIRTMDMTAVEIDSTSKIKIEEIDDDTNIENPNTMYMCKYCPKAYSTSHHLIMHSRKSHVCQFCMECFVKVEDLHRHTREKHSSFTCTLCDKGFTNNSNLRQHLKRVHHINLPAYVSLLSVKRNDTIT